MGSRMNSNLKHVFHCFMEVKQPSGEKIGKPGIVQCYPESYKEKDKIPDFVYPCTFTVTNVELFSFALTNLEGKLTFGFARHAPRSETALVVVSALPWHDFFYKLLNTCAQIMHDSSGDEVPDLLQKFLCDVYNSKLPRPGSDFSLEYGSLGKVFSSSTPDPTRLPSIPDNRNLSEYFNFVDVNNMITIFFSMLNERRVIVTSKKVSRLTACIQAASSLLYPLSWQYLYIPVLPGPMIDFLTAPVPFLMGVPDVTLKRKPAAEIGEVVILDADSNTVKNPFADEDIFPPEVASTLKKNLKEKDKIGDHVARSFLQAMVHLIGGYRDALRYRQGEKIVFDRDLFVQSRSSSLQPFLTKLLQIQMFQSFKDERLELLNSGKGYTDEFELECVAFAERAPSRRFTPFDSVKKDGGALIKKVKNKTNPVMKNVLDGGKKAGERVRDSSKIAKSKAKATINEVKSKFRDNHEQFREDNSSSGTHSAPSSPSQSRRSSVNNYHTLSNHGGGNLPRQNTDLGLSTPSSAANFMTSPTAQILKYKRFDPSTSSASLHSPPADDHLSPAASDDFNLMQDIDEVFNKQKPSAVYSQFGSLASGMNITGGSSGGFGSTANSTPNHQSSQDKSRKPSVGDLINLSHDDDPGGVHSADFFDPLGSSHTNSSSNQNTYSSFANNTPSQNNFGGQDAAGNHRKLSRTDASLSGLINPQTQGNSSSMNSFLYPSTAAPQPRTGTQRVSNHSQGKYENYVPPGGVNHQTQFKHFMSSMTDGGAGGNSGHQALKRSSEDLLKDYGLLELSNIRLGTQMASQNNRSATLLAGAGISGGSGGQNSSTNSSTSASFLNGYMSSNNSSGFQLNGHGNSGGVNNTSYPQPPPRASTIGPPPVLPPSSQQRSVSATSAPDMSRNGHSGGNNSFLFNSSPVMPATNFTTGGSANLPVNQRLEPMPNTTSISGVNKKGLYPTSNTTNNNNHFLSDLDPLCSSSNGTAAGKPELDRTNLTPSPGSSTGFGGHRQPPAIPPRGKKQWTTFEN